MSRRVVITGMGIVSCLGNDADTVASALYDGHSGISRCEQHIEAGMRSHIAGTPQIEISELIDRKQLRFMGDAAAYAYIAMQQAIADSGLEESDVSNVRTGIIAGSGGASSANQTEAADILRERGLRRVGPYRVTQTMGSTVSACLATPFRIKGVNYSISSACSTSAHCIGNAMEQIQLNKQDVIFAGGGEELHWTLSCLFDAMGALSTKYNDTPERASRAYDASDLRLQDTSLFARDLWKRVTENPLVLEADVRDDRNLRRHEVGRVEATSEPNLQNDDVTVGVAKRFKRQKGRVFEESERGKAGVGSKLLDAAGCFALRNRPP